MNQTDPVHSRARKRQRIDSISSSTSTSLTAIDHSLQLQPEDPQHTRNMRFPESDHDSTLSVSLDDPSEAGPSSVTFAAGGSSNGHTNGNGCSALAMNGSSSAGTQMGNGVQKNAGKSIARVSLPGTSLYDDSQIDREEFVRLVIQSLRDVGYIESAATLEAESGYAMESPEVSQFRRHILEGEWSNADAALVHLGVTDDDSLWEARFFISQQKYLELLEAKKTTAALHVLRNELAPMNVDSDILHSLSSLIMCSDPADLRQRAGWDGASGSSRRALLISLQRYIPSSIMIPQRRFSTLLHQARLYQRQHCVYHNLPTSSAAYSLYMDHQCDKDAFPRVTTAILDIHSDEVWNIEWSHDGSHLASASKDKTAIIWRVGSETEPALREYAQEFVLRDHPYPVGCLAWSLDDSLLLTSAENFIKVWNTKTGLCVHTLDAQGSPDAHTETVTALSWLPDGSGFISGGLDRKIIVWDVDGKLRDTWGTTAIRVTDLAITPDFTRLVAIGMQHLPTTPSVINVAQPSAGEVAAPPAGGNAQAMNVTRSTEQRMIVYDMVTKQTESSIRLEGELTSVKISQDSQYALINHAPDEIHLWDLFTGRLARRFTGQRQGRHVIRSCFGGVDGNFVVSGSEDSNVYVWHRDTGTLLEVLSGHGVGSVNSVAWNPRNERMFASCSDDHTIRIWEAPAPHDAIEPRVDEPSGSGNSKGKTRQRWDGESAEYGNGVERI